VNSNPKRATRNPGKSSPDIIKRIKERFPYYADPTLDPGWQVAFSEFF